MSLCVCETSRFNRIHNEPAALYNRRLNTSVEQMTTVMLTVQQKWSNRTRGMVLPQEMDTKTLSYCRGKTLVAKSAEREHERRDGICWKKKGHRHGEFFRAKQKF